MTANGEVRTREKATVYVKELDLFVTVLLLEETPQFFPWGSSERIMGIITTGQKTHLTKKAMARELIAIYQTICHS